MDNESVQTAVEEIQATLADVERDDAHPLVESKFQSLRNTLRDLEALASGDQEIKTLAFTMFVPGDEPDNTDEGEMPSAARELSSGPVRVADRGFDEERGKSYSVMEMYFTSDDLDTMAGQDEEKTLEVIQREFTSKFGQMFKNPPGGVDFGFDCDPSQIELVPGNAASA